MIENKKHQRERYEWRRERCGGGRISVKKKARAAHTTQNVIKTYQKYAKNLKGGKENQGGLIFFFNSNYNIDTNICLKPDYFYKTSPINSSVEFLINSFHKSIQFTLEVGRTGL